MVSTADSFCDGVYNKYPYIEIKNIEARNLEPFAENCIQMKSYLKISLGNYYNKTQAIRSNTCVVWKNTFEIPCSGFDPLVVRLMDHDEFDGDIMLAGVSIPIEILKQFTTEKI